MNAIPPEAPYSCSLCPRLVAYRQENQVQEPGWHNGPVDSFGPESARFLVVGMAPGRTGANRTGRPFTGDGAGDLLFATLLQTGFARGVYKQSPDDGLQMVDTMITNVVRCVPPQNRPTGAEANACRPFFKSRVDALPNLKVILALGHIAHNNVLRAFGLRLKDFKFGHNARHDLQVDGRGMVLLDSYHCSRYNTNTGRLTQAMFDDVFNQAKVLLQDMES